MSRQILEQIPQNLHLHQCHFLGVLYGAERCDFLSSAGLVLLARFVLDQGFNKK